MPCQVGDSQPPGELGRWVLQTQNATSHIARLHAANWGKYWLIKDHQRAKLSVRLNGKWKKKPHNTDHFCIIAESAIFFPQLWSEILTFSLQIWLKSLVNSQTGCEFITQYWEHLGFFILLKWSFFFFPPQMLHGARSVHYKWKVIPQKEIFYLEL